MKRTPNAGQMTSLTFEYGSKTIQELVFFYEHDQLNLDPGFQRKSVWSDRDRRKLIESICTGCPLPSIFLYRRPGDDGRLVYDVIDGKQRTEAILMFQGASGFRGRRFGAKIQLPPDDEPRDHDWNSLRKRGFEHQFMGYKLQTVEVAGALADIIDLFVRINSTGKRLTTAEQRHARYYHSAFLKQAGRVAQHKLTFLTDNKILSPTQISRMKHVELVCELLASIVAKGPINKKSALDSIIGGQTVAAATLAKASTQLTSTLNRIARILPTLRETRFRHSVDFYSLFMFFWQLDAEGAILTDTRRNRQAVLLLTQLSNGVDDVREQVRKVVGVKPGQKIFADYLLTIQGDTDSLATRQRRAAILGQLLSGVFNRKDDRRGFSAEQRRLLWNSDEERRCASCKTKLSWANFTIDHVKPHSRGGRTEIKNAALLCGSCNSRKGSRSA